MNVGKTLFAQVMEYVPWKTFGRIIDRHGGDARTRQAGFTAIADAKEKSPLATEAKPLGRAADNLSKINADMREVRRSDATNVKPARVMRKRSFWLPLPDRAKRSSLPS